MITRASFSLPAAALTLLLATPALATEMTGNAWLQATPNEQLGYSYGMADCAAGTAHLSFPQSYQAYADQLTAHFTAATPQARNTPVAKSYLAMASHSPTNPAPTTRSNGLLWLQIGLRPLMQRGYIEGALECEAHLHPTTARFTQSPQAFVNQINLWYGQVPGTDQVDAAREAAPILSVLRRYQNGAPPRTAPHHPASP